MTRDGPVAGGPGQIIAQIASECPGWALTGTNQTTNYLSMSQFN